MARRHTVFEPTLLIFADRPPALRLAGAIARLAHARGVTMIAGTDTLGAADAGSLPNLHRELELLVTLAGLSPAEALESATRDAAAVLGADSVAARSRWGNWPIWWSCDPIRCSISAIPARFSSS